MQTRPQDYAPRRQAEPPGQDVTKGTGHLCEGHNVEYDYSKLGPQLFVDAAVMLMLQDAIYGMEQAVPWNLAEVIHSNVYACLACGGRCGVRRRRLRAVAV